MTDTERFERELGQLQTSLNRFVEMRASFGLNEREQATYRALCEREASMLAGLRRLSDALAAA